MGKEDQYEEQKVSGGRKNGRVTRKLDRSKEEKGLVRARATRVTELKSQEVLNSTYISSEPRKTSSLPGYDHRIVLLPTRMGPPT